MSYLLKLLDNYLCYLNKYPLNAKDMLLRAKLLLIAIKLIAHFS